MLKLIKTKAEYEDALEKIYNLMQLDLVKGSPKGDELEVLSLLVHAYEEEHYPILPLNPLDAIKCQIEQMGFRKPRRISVRHDQRGPREGPQH